MGQSFLWGAPFKAKHVFYPDQYPPAGFLHLGESHHGATWLRLGGSWGTDLGLKNWNSPPLEVQKKKIIPRILQAFGRSNLQPQTANGLFLGGLRGSNFRPFGAFRYAWWPRLVKIHLSDLFVLGSSFILTPCSAYQKRAHLELSFIPEVQR